MNRSQVCETIGDRFNAMSLLNGDVCDVVLVRVNPVITGQDGRELNKFTLMNSVLEFELPETTMTSLNSDNVYVMGDFALLETELNDVLRNIAGYNNWMVTGIHNHMILESPKTTFIHWEANNDIESLIAQIRSVLADTTIPANGINPTPSPTPTPSPSPGTTTSPSPSPTASASPSPTPSPTVSPTVSPSPSPSPGTSGQITLAVIEHLCPASFVNTEENLDSAITACPAILRNGTNDFMHVVRVRDVNDIFNVYNLSGGGTLSGDMYTWSVPRTDVTIDETIMPRNSRLGFAELDPADTDSLISEGSGIVNLDTRNDPDGIITLHFFNFSR